MATMSLQAAYDQARNYLEANQVDQAIGVAQQILDHFPENLEAHRVLGEAYLAGRQFDQAEAAFSRVLFVDPESIPAHVGLGITFERQGNLEHAVAEFEQALEIRPDMPELRGQLLRLYTDLWGAEGATLRLSRPGLARLYAKGHMLPQAIQEFRGVIEEHPDRFDARVGLAEALWRDGQEEAVVELCEQILARRPEVLKANLLLGYILLAGGDPAGEAYWRHAQALDPYELVAHALFDTMPGIVGSELVVPAWDEAAWLARRAQADEPPDALPLAEEPDAVFAQAAPPVEPTVTAEEVLPELPPSPPVSDFDDEDDFLASLLAMDAGSAEETAFAEASGVTPFSFDEQPPLAESLAPSDVEPSTSAFAFTEDVAPVEYAAPAAEDDVDLTPFSLDDLGLSADELAQLEAAVPAEEAAPAAEDDVDLTPFSLDDLGLSTDEIAQLEAAVPAEEAAPAAEDDVDLTPFSLDDLGLSADELAQLEAAVPAEEAAPAAAAEDDVDLTPFSLDDLGLSADELAQLEAAVPAEEAAPAAEDDVNLTPFSLDDLGLSADEIAQLEAAVPAEEAAPAAAAEDDVDLTPFSLDDLGLSADELAQLEAAVPAEEAAPAAEDDVDLTPFSLDDLGLSADEIAQLEAAVPAEEAAAEDDVDLTPFSLDDLGLSADELAQLEAAVPAEEAAPAAAAEDDVDLTPFSLDDLGLSADEIAQLEAAVPAEEAAPAAAAEDDVDLTPFSLDDLGLSADEIAQLEAAVPAEEAAPAAAAEDDVDLTPFSLDDLGLSADELANFEAAIAAEEAGKGQEMRQTQGTEEEGTAAFSEMIDLDLNFDDLQPFSLDDLDLSNLEEGTEGLPSFLQPFSLEEATATPSEKEAPERDEPEIFSWQEPAARERTSFGQQEEPEPSGVSIFGKLTQQAAERPPHEPPPLAPVDDEEAEASGYFSDDDVALREEMSGRPERFVSGFRLPREGEELAAEAPAEVEPTQVEPAEFTLSPPPEQDVDLTPFSLADLGLSPEEIAALEAEAAEGAAMTASSEMGLLGDDVDLTPFSLADLGLSPEEIAALEGVELPEATPGEDVDLTPFSLADLGLSPEEIAALEASNQDQFNLPVTGETIVPGWSRGEEPELIPFSPQVEPPITPEEATPERLETDQPASELSTDEALEFTDIFEGDVQPFSFDEFELETGEPRTREHDDEGISGDVQPFSLDDLDLGDLDAFAPDAEERKLGVTSEELAGLDLGNLESMTGERPSLKIADDPAAALGHLTTLGQQQGYVDLTDIISMVSDPETEADQIEQMAWSLHHAGIQIRDGDEIIDLEGEAESEELEAIGDVFDAEARLAESQPSSPELEPFSLNELGLSDDELAALGLASLDQPEAAAPGPPEGEDADLTPFSLADLGLTPDEIALFEADLSEETEEPGPAMVPTSEPEAELEPFSLTDLGLSPDEIAMLEASVEQADLLGASTDQDASAPTVDATGEEEPGSTEAIDEDEFNFDLTEATPVERVTARTEPRIEAPVTEADPADTDFEPEPLDNLDDIWDASAEEAEPLTPARVVLPPMSERFAEPPPPPRPTSITPTVPPASPPLSRDEERYARREAATRRYREQERQPRRFQQAEATAALATAAEFAGFVPTGDTLLDDYLGQLDEEPDNHGLAMAIGHLCAQTNRPDIMTRAFKRVIRAGQGLEQIVSELETLMASVEEPAIKQPLTRLLGDAYSKQGRYTEAMQAYGATFTR